MEFDEMQVIWHEQNNEKLYAINEDGLHKMIVKKSRALNKWLGAVDWMMMLVNLGVGIFMLFEMVQDHEPAAVLILPGMYILYGLGAPLFRLRRKRMQMKFEPTVLGEVDKALWQVNYLIKQNFMLLAWYLLPLSLAAAVYLFWEGSPIWALFMLLVLPLGGYWGVRWENRKWHGRKKMELEELREKLLI